MINRRHVGKRGTRRAPLATQADVRIGPMQPMRTLLAEHGFDPSRVLVGVGLDPRLFDDPENRVSFQALGALLETCASLTRCRHFGLSVGERFDMDSLGILGQLMRNSPTVGDALRLAAVHLDVHDRGAVSLTLELGNAQCALGYSLFDARIPGAEQIIDGAIAMQHRLLRFLCGNGWKARSIRLSHRRPERIGPLRAVFGTKMEFDAPLSAIVFDSRWLDHRIAGADPSAYAAVVATIESQQPAAVPSFAAQVRRAAHAMMFTASATAPNLARLFNLHERTFRRRLAEEGGTVRGIVTEVRRELARHLLSSTDLPVTDVASALGYSDATVFARAFRSWSDASPREWRARARSR